MAIVNVANSLMALCKEGKIDEAIDTHYSDHVVSVEPTGDPATVTGIAAVKAKSEWWKSSFEVHTFEVIGPFINGNQFALRFVIDATFRTSGKRSILDEIAVYTVEDDKVVHEIFLYGSLGES